MSLVSVLDIWVRSTNGQQYEVSWVRHSRFADGGADIKLRNLLTDHHHWVSLARLRKHYRRIETGEPVKDIADHAIFGPQVYTCPSPGCGIRLIRVTPAGKLAIAAVEIEPHDSGTIRLTDTGGVLPLAQILTIAQQFGRRGTLHRVHDCPKVRKRR